MSQHKWQNVHVYVPCLLLFTHITAADEGRHFKYHIHNIKLALDSATVLQYLMVPFFSKYLGFEDCPKDQGNSIQRALFHSPMFLSTVRWLIPAHELFLISIVFSSFRMKI